MIYIDPMAMPMDDTTVWDYGVSNPKKGYLKLQLTTARQALPVPNAKITISKTIGDETYSFVEVTTDEDGLTPLIALPAPDKALSEIPQSKKPYASYDILIEHPKYRTVQLINVPVFDGITSIQPVEMFVKTKENTTPEKIVESEPTDL